MRISILELVGLIALSAIVCWSIRDGILPSVAKTMIAVCLIRVTAVTLRRGPVSRNYLMINGAMSAFVGLCMYGGFVIAMYSVKLQSVPSSDRPQMIYELRSELPAMFVNIYTLGTIVTGVLIGWVAYRIRLDIDRLT